MNQSILDKLAVGYTVVEGLGSKECIQYMRGAQEYINAIWHDGTEMPDLDRKILMYYHYDDDYDVFALGTDEERNLMFKGRNAGEDRWAYIEDLLPYEPRKWRKEKTE